MTIKHLDNSPVDEITTANALAWFENRKTGIALSGARAMYDKAIIALHAQQEAEKNELLTLDELREMDGEPVWVCQKRPGGNILKRWMLLVCFFKGKGLYLFQPTSGIVQGYSELNYGKSWMAYRHKLEEN